MRNEFPFSSNCMRIPPTGRTPHPWRRITITCLFAAALTACGGGGGSGTSTPPPSQGSLIVTITSLPSGSAASVTVSGPNGYSTQLTSSQTLQLSPGSYTVAANPVGVGSSTYYSAVASQTATVAISTPVSVTVNYSTIIPNSTKILDSVGMSGLTVSSDGSTVTLPTSSTVAISLAPGNVLASAQAPAVPNGLLVKILSVSTSDQTVTASVQQATLEDAIQQTSFQFTETLGPGNTTPNVSAKNRFPSRRTANRFRRQDSSSGTGACVGNPNTIQLPFNVQLAGGGTASLALSGEDDFCPSFTFALQISGFKIVSANATVTMGIHTSIGLLDNATETFNRTTNLATLTASPTELLIGGIPVIIQPTLTPFVGASGSVSGNVYTSITTDSTVTVGASYANGTWSPIDSGTSIPVVSNSTSVDGQATVKAFAGLQAGALLDGFVTPSLSGDAYLQFSSTLTGSPCWTLKDGDEASASVTATFLGVSLLNYSSPTVNLFSNQVAQATSTCFAPLLTSVTPSTAGVMSQQLTLALTGTNFVPDSTVNFNGQPLATTFIDPNDMTAVVPASDLAGAGTFPITVTNPDNPGGTSDPFAFAVGGVIVSVSPTAAGIPINSSQQFTATVQDTSNTAVTWSVNGIIGGNSTFGTITGKGVYSAPGTVPNPAAVTVAAASQANPSVSASATVTVTTALYNFVTIIYQGSSTFLYGINNNGQIVGSNDLGSGQGFLYSGGAFSSIDYPGAPVGYTTPYGINDSGQIVGSYQDQALNTHGFLYSGGTFSTIDYPGGSGSAATGINNSGQIVGAYEDQAFNGYGFLYNGGTFSTINYPGSNQTAPSGINDVGQIVGTEGSWGFLYSGGEFALINDPNSSGPSLIWGINDSGQIVGDGPPQTLLPGPAYIYSGGIFTFVEDPGAPAPFYLYGINDSGQIVGYDNYSQGVLGTPVQ
jgi:probable HAF family extracellular repeat protein